MCRGSTLQKSVISWAAAPEPEGQLIALAGHPALLLIPINASSCRTTSLHHELPGRGGNPSNHVYALGGASGHCSQPGTAAVPGCELRGVRAPAIGPGGETPPELAGEDACGTEGSPRMRPALGTVGALPRSSGDNPETPDLGLAAPGGGLGTKRNGLATLGTRLATKRSSFATKGLGLATKRFGLNTKSSDFAGKKSSLAIQGFGLETKSSGFAMKSSGLNTKSSGLAAKSAGLAIKNFGFGTRNPGLATPKSRPATSGHDQFPVVHHNNTVFHN